MKKTLIVFAVFMFVVVGLSAQAAKSLDAVIEEAAKTIENALPQGTKLAVLNFASSAEAFSDYVIDEFTGALVRGRKVTMVDRQNLALIRQEMNLQLSGDVSDESALAIGRQVGAQSIVSGALTNLGTYYRFRVRVINVETAAIQEQYSYNMQNDAQVAFLLSGNQGSGPSAAGTPAPSATTPRSAQTTSSITGITVPGTNLTEKLAWLQRSADSHNTYIVEVNANESIDRHTFEFRGGINITIVMRGVGANRTIRLRSHGTMFRVNPNVTFILDNNITLQGHSGNSGSMVRIETGGTFKMNNGSTITGNITSEAGGGVYVRGTFEMTGGTISDNTTSQRGGGVFHYGGTFTMTGGTISGNIASRGGGVWMDSPFNMRGGTISGNTAREYGGGVYVSGTFNKGGGTITGYSSDQTNGNVVKDDAGNILARRGHAAYVNENRRKETTAGPGVNLKNDASGGWDN